MGLIYGPCDYCLECRLSLFLSILFDENIILKLLGVTNFVSYFFLAIINFLSFELDLALLESTEGLLLLFIMGNTEMLSVSLLWN